MESVGNGTETATGVEQDLDEEVSASGTYVLKTNLSNMEAGDTVYFRMYDKVVLGGDYALAQEVRYDGVQAIPVVLSEPWPFTVACKVTLEQTAGSYQDYEWNLLKV